MVNETTVGINIKADAGQATQSVNSLKVQLKAAQDDVVALSDKFGATSEEAINAAKKVGELTNKIGDTKKLTEAFNPEAKFKAFSSTLSAVAGGFGAIQGALALVGVESKDVEKTLLKVQSAMALSQGLQSISEGIGSFKLMKAVAIDTFKGIRTAIGSTGIGLFVIALGAIYTYWDKIKAAVSGVSKEQIKLNETSKKNLEVEKQKLSVIDGQDNILKLQGKTEKQILQLKIAQTDQVIAATEEQIKQQQVTLKAQIEAEKRNKEILKGILKFVEYPLVSVLKTIDDIGKVVGKNFGLAEKFTAGTASLLFDPEETKAKGEAELKELDNQLKQLRNARAGYQLTIKNIDKKASDDTKAQAEADAQWEDQLLQYQIDRLKSHYEEQQKLRDESFKKEEENRKAKEEYEKKLAENTKKNLDDGFNRNITYLNNLKQANLDAAKANMELAEEEAKFKKARLDETANALQSLTTIVGKDTAAGKALAIATALINTYQGASEALKQKSTLPSPLDFAAKAINVGAIIATGLKAVKSITAVKVPSVGGGASIAAPSIPAPITPSAPLVNTRTMLESTTIQQMGSATNRAYVVESDISSSQERIRRINRAARLA